MLRGAGLMSQASGLGPASARTITGAPTKVRLCSCRSCFCPLHSPALQHKRVLSVSPLALRKASVWSVQCDLYNLACAEWQQWGRKTQDSVVHIKRQGVPR